ncbi:MAG: roadblock/LC7 domain-containing protein [Deltaproteobacteria bacterium]|nr:roadblock/LC7 domain-containing protein [Deltaproteobacteria bacterium]
MKETVIEEAMRIRGVRGVAVVGQSGKVSASSIDARELNEFFELLFRVASPSDSDSGLGAVKRIMVRTDRAEVLSLMMHSKEALGIVSEKWRPMAELCADVKALLPGV